MGLPIKAGRVVEDPGNRELVLTHDVRHAHMLVVGASQSGKTTAVRNMVRQDIRNGHAVVFIDPHEAVYEELLSYCALREDTWSRVYLLDPSDDDALPSIDYFDMPGADKDDTVDLVIEAMYKSQQKVDRETQPLFEKWGRASVRPLLDAGLTLAELDPFLQDEEFRNAVLDAVGHERSTRRWLKLPPKDEAWNLLAIDNRSSQLTDKERLRCIFGQRGNTVPWPEVFEKGGIVLVNLHQTPTAARLVGVALIHQIIHAGLQRAKGRPGRPCYVYVDEFAQVITDDYLRAVKELLGFGVRFVLVQQDLSDLIYGGDERMYRSILNSTDMKLVMGMNDPDQIEYLVRMLFRDKITGEDVKYYATDVQVIPYVSSRRQSGFSYTTTESTGGERSLASTMQTGWQPVVEYDEQLVERTPVYYSLEEDRNRYARLIGTLPPLEGVFQIHRSSPALRVRFEQPPPLLCLPDRMARFLEFVRARTRLRAKREILEEVESRPKRYIDGIREASPAVSPPPADNPVADRKRRRIRPTEEGPTP